MNFTSPVITWELFVLWLCVAKPQWACYMLISNQCLIFTIWQNLDQILLPSFLPFFFLYIPVKFVWQFSWTLLYLATPNLTWLYLWTSTFAFLCRGMMNCLFKQHCSPAVFNLEWNDFSHFIFTLKLLLCIYQIPFANLFSPS